MRHVSDEFISKLNELVETCFSDGMGPEASEMGICLEDILTEEGVLISMPTDKRP